MKRIKSGIRWGVFFGAMTSIYGNTEPDKAWKQPRPKLCYGSIRIKREVAR